jgi:hypothetical protein
MYNPETRVKLITEDTEQRQSIKQKQTNKQTQQR